MDQQSNFIIGPGALGLTLGLTLAEHYSVSLVSAPNKLAEIQGQEVSLSFPDGKMIRRILDALSFVDLPQFPGHATIWICVKAYQLNEVYREIIPRLNGSQTIVLCSNGLGLYQEALPLFRSKAKLLRLLAWFGSRKTGPDSVSLAGTLLVSLVAEASEPLFKILNQSGFKTETAISAESAEWSKAATNMVVNSICTINNVTNGALLTDPELNVQARKLLSEVRSVARKVGQAASIPSDEHFFKLVEISASNINSTLVDKRAGRQTEIGFLLGRLVQIAEAHQVAVPLAQSLLANI